MKIVIEMFVQFEINNYLCGKLESKREKYVYISE